MRATPSASRRRTPRRIISWGWCSPRPTARSSASTITARCWSWPASEEPITLANLAWNLKNQGRIEESRALYMRSMALKPDVLQTVLGYAKMEEADRQFDRALDLLDEAERLLPITPACSSPAPPCCSR